MKIAIIGCGFAGMSCALFLSKNHHVELFEKFPEPKAVGAGILLQPSVWSILKELEILEELQAVGEKVDYLQANLKSGFCVFKTPYNKVSPELYGLGILRSALFDALYNKLKQSSVKLHLGVEVLTLSDIAANFDLVVVANGSYSNLREQVPIVKSIKQYSYSCLWTTIEEEKEYPGVLQQYLKGSQEMFGFLPSGVKDGKRMMSVFWSLPTRERATWEAEFDRIVQRMRKYPVNKVILDKIEAQPFSFAQYLHVELKKPFYKNILFIGDAAHAMSPQLGQGANMALKDSFTLYQCLKEKFNLGDALRLYEKRRKPQLRFYGQATKLLTVLFQSDCFWCGIIRNLIFIPTQKIGFTQKISANILAGKKTRWFS